MRRIGSALTLITALFALAASSAWAQRPIPPGNSAADQYAEGAPGADGNNAPSNKGGGSDGGGLGGGGSGGSQGGGGSSSSGLSPSVENDLQQQGATGATAATALGANAPNRGSGSQSNRGAGLGSGPGGAGQGSGSGASANEGSALGDIADSLLTGSDEGGMGVALPILLALALLGGLLLVVRRRIGGDRGDQTPSGG